MEPPEYPPTWPKGTPLSRNNPCFEIFLLDDPAVLYSMTDGLTTYSCQMVGINKDGQMGDIVNPDTIPLFSIRSVTEWILTDGESAWDGLGFAAARSPLPQNIIKRIIQIHVNTNREFISVCT